MIKRRLCWRDGGKDRKGQAFLFKGSPSGRGSLGIQGDTYRVKSRLKSSGYGNPGPFFSAGDGAVGFYDPGIP
jgi:hypothetical protein